MLHCPVPLLQCLRVYNQWNFDKNLSGDVRGLVRYMAAANIPSLSPCLARTITPRTLLSDVPVVVDIDKWKEDKMVIHQLTFLYPATASN